MIIGRGLMGALEERLQNINQDGHFTMALENINQLPFRVSWLIGQLMENKLPLIFLESDDHSATAALQQQTIKREQNKFT